MNEPHRASNVKMRNKSIEGLVQQIRSPAQRCLLKQRVSDKNKARGFTL
jgi:hypothetical protein